MEKFSLTVIIDFIINFELFMIAIIAMVVVAITMKIIISN